MRGVRFSVLSIPLFVSLLLAGCAGSSEGPDLIAAQQTYSLRYYVGPPTDGEEAERFDDLANNVPPFIQSECDNDYSSGSCGARPADGTDGQCAWILCELDGMVCEVNHMLKIANTTNIVTFLQWQGAASQIRVPKQSADVSRALHEAALRELTLVLNMKHAIEQIDTSPDCSLPVAWGPDSSGTTDPITKLESRLQQSFLQALDIVDALADDYLASSEANLSFVTDNSFGNDLATGGDVSFGEAQRTRLIAASYLAGGLDFQNKADFSDYPASYVEDAGLCTTSSLSDAAMDARRLIRESGISPDKILAIPQLSGSGGAGGTAPIQTIIAEVEARLTELWARLDWQPDFLTSVGLRETDFAEAREQMAQEIRVFGRSRSAVLDQIPNCTPLAEFPDMCTRYAATVNPPIEAPWPYYASYGVMNDGSGSGFGDAQSNASAHPPRVKVALVLRGMARELRGLQDAAAKQAGRRLENLVYEELDGAIAITPKGDGGLGVFVGSRRYDPANMIAVTSTDALSCALRGEIEGAPCEWQDVQAASLATKVTYDVGDPVTGFPNTDGTCDAFQPQQDPDRTIHLGTRCARFEIPPPGQNARPDRVYVLRLRLGAAKQSPGSYEGHAVDWPVLFDSPSAPAFLVNYITPRMQRRAAEIMTPARSWCARPKYSCAGADFDSRLPLEDELIEDGDAFESSWRSYLVKARRAAEEADFFGREAANAIFQIDRITEDALAEVEDLCGITVPINLVTEQLQTLIDSYNPDDESPTNIAPTMANAVEQLSTPPDIERLKACLGTQGIIEFVGLGSDPLCAWYYGPEDTDGRDVSTICREDPNHPIGDRACPSRAAASEPGKEPEADDCLDQVPGPPEVPAGVYHSVFVNADDPDGYDADGASDNDTSELLNLFDEPKSGPGAAEDSRLDTVCTGVRELRHALQGGNWGAARWWWFVAFKDNGFWSRGKLADLARGIRWVMKPGDFSTLYVNGAAAISTGDIHDGNGIAGYGPCANEDARGFACTFWNGTSEVPDIPGKNSSPFCGSYTLSCNDREARYAYNYRLGRAAVLARWLAGLDLRGFQVPWSATAMPADDPIDLFDIDGNLWTELGAHRLGEAPLKNDPSTTLYCAVPYGSLSGHIIPPQFSSQHPSLFHYKDQGQWLYAPAVCGDQAPVAEVGKSFAWRKRYETYRWAGFSKIGDDKPWGQRAIGNNSVVTRSRLDADSILTNITKRPISTSGLPFYKLSNWLGQAFIRDDPFLIKPVNDLPWTVASRGVDKRDEYGPRAPYEKGVTFFMPERNHIGRDELLDAFELLCEAGAQRETPGAIDVQETIANLEDLTPEQREDLDPRLLAFVIEAAADGIEAFGSRIVLRSVPTEVVEVIKGQAQGVAPIVGGRYGEEVNRMRAALVQMATVPRLIAAELRGFAREAEYFENELERGAIQEELARIEFEKTRSREMAACAVAVAQIARSGGIRSVFNPGALVASVASAAATCSNSRNQIRLAARASGLQQQIIDINEEQATISFAGQTDDRFMNLGELSDRLAVSVNEFNAALLSLEGLRTKTARALRRALWLSSDDTEEMFDSNATLRNQFTAAQTRYERAQRDAKRMAFLARRAIEQRFGLHLDEIERDMTLVEAPKTWVNQYCTLDGVDFSVRRSQELGKDIDGPGKHFSEGYIGEYVTKLENFVESYRLDFPFQNGQDTAVVSLRDDIQRVQAICSIDVPNEVRYSSQLDVLADEESPGWQKFGCDDAEPNCVMIEPLDADSFGSSDYQFGEPVPYRLTFGADHPACVASEPECPCTGPCGYEPESRFGQEISLGQGTYRVSWYQQTYNQPKVAIERATLVAAGQQLQREWTETWSSQTESPACELDENGSAMDFPNGSADTDPSCVNHPGGWIRYGFLFDSNQTETVRFTIAPDTPGYGGQVDIAGVMVEPLGSQSETPNKWPQSYYATDANLQSNAELCEDTDGEVFRSKGWRRNCVRLCDDGFGISCTEAQSSLYCYRETDFTITHRGIQRAEQLALSGFARGNFNYRIDTVGVNFVGSSTRDCSEVDFASTCYSGGWIPFTLEHHGPHRVRNHSGGTYEAPLFPGIIEHARGLATQRYLTNPLSGADSQQIGQFMQGQYRGRPLTGSYTLRVWEEPGVNFDGIEDVQILLNYRFWTRQE